VPAGIILANDRPEWAILRGEVSWHGGNNLAPGAANFGSIHVIPVANRVTVVRRTVLINNTAAAIGVRLGLALSAIIDSSLGTATRDFRRFASSTRIGLRAQAADLLASIRPYQVPANNNVIIDLDWMLGINTGTGPNTGTLTLVVQGDVVNQNVIANFYGYERRLRPEEQTVD
jgi:hypothetical protein